MSKYGVTPNGFVKKRLDECITEVQTELTEELGFDVSLNPQSYLNVMLTSFLDRVAQLWEVAEQTYYAMYPSSAEGVSLDNAGQFGGIARKLDDRTKYMILCTGTDGTTLPKGTRIASNTMPVVYFQNYTDYEISRASMNKATVRVVSVSDNTSYIVTLNGNSYTALSGVNASKAKIIADLATAVTEDGFTVTADGENLHIECDSKVKNNVLALSGNLTTDSVSTLAIFQSEEFGKVVLPDNAITDIVTTVTGFSSCYNLGSPYYGRLRETDVEYRQSYIKKIASRSSMMLESITSAILEEVYGADSATGYENDTDETDEEGRPPHSIEIVVDGGDDSDISAQILKKKAAGIATHGNISVDVPDVYGNPITVRFNRPNSVYVWLKVELTRNPKQAMPPNYEELVKEAIVDSSDAIKAGDSIITQDYFSSIKERCSGIGYMDISAFSSTNPNAAPTEYPEKNVYVTTRQKAVITSDRIEVVLNGS